MDSTGIGFARSRGTHPDDSSLPEPRRLCSRRMENAPSRGNPMCSKGSTTKGCFPGRWRPSLELPTRTSCASCTHCTHCTCTSSCTERKRSYAGNSHSTQRTSTASSKSTASSITSRSRGQMESTSSRITFRSRAPSPHATAPLGYCPFPEHTC